MTRSYFLQQAIEDKRQQATASEEGHLWMRDDNNKQWQEMSNNMGQQATICNKQGTVSNDKQC